MTKITPVTWHGVKGDGMNSFDLTPGTALKIDDETREHKPITMSAEEVRRWRYVGIMRWIQGATYIVFATKDRTVEVAQPWVQEEGPSKGVRVKVRGEGKAPRMAPEPSPEPRDKPRRVRRGSLDTSFLD